MAKMIQCPKCGKPYYSTTAVCPECGMPKPKNTKKTVAIVLACIAGVLVIGLFGVFLWQMDNKPVTEIETGGIPSSSEMQSNQKNKNIINVGGTLKANDVEIEFVNVEDVETGIVNREPESGNKFIRVYFYFTNIGKFDIYVDLWQDFECYVDNVKADSIILEGDDCFYSPETISAGRSYKGYLYYEVPVNADSIEIEYDYEVNWWTYKKAVFKVK